MAEHVSRDQILRRERGQENIHFPCSSDHEQDWPPYLVDPNSAICDDHTVQVHILYYDRGIIITVVMILQGVGMHVYFSTDHTILEDVTPSYLIFRRLSVFLCLPYMLT